MARSPACSCEISGGAGKLSTSVDLFLPRKFLLRRRRVESSARRTSTSPFNPTAVRARLKKRVRPRLERVLFVEWGSASVSIMAGLALLRRVLQEAGGFLNRRGHSRPASAGGRWWWRRECRARSRLPPG